MKQFDLYTSFGPAILTVTNWTVSVPVAAYNIARFVIKIDFVPFYMSISSVQNTSSLCSFL